MITVRVCVLVKYLDIMIQENIFMSPRKASTMECVSLDPFNPCIFSGVQVVSKQQFVANIYQECVV